MLLPPRSNKFYTKSHNSNIQYLPKCAHMHSRPIVILCIARRYITNYLTNINYTSWSTVIYIYDASILMTCGKIPLNYATININIVLFRITNPLLCRVINYSTEFETHTHTGLPEFMLLYNIHFTT